MCVTLVRVGASVYALLSVFASVGVYSAAFVCVCLLWLCFLECLPFVVCAVCVFLIALCVYECFT